MRPASSVREKKHFLPALCKITPLTYELFSCNIMWNKNQQL